MKNKLYKAALVLGGFFLGILIMETAVRILDIKPRPLDPLPIPSYQLSKNPIIGYEFRPGYKPDKESFDYSHKNYSINKDGFRDYEYSKSKPKGVKRIIFLGDSTTAGNGVPDLKNTYTKQLEVLLNQQKNRKTNYEVLNMGVGGYHTMQEIETLRVKGLKYNPDMVFVTFCVNDFYLDSDGGVFNALSEKNKLYHPWSNINFYIKESRLAFILYNRLISKKSGYYDWYTKDVLKNKSTVEVGFQALSNLQKKYNFTAIVLILPGFSYSLRDYKLVLIKVLNSVEKFPNIKVIDLLKDFINVSQNPKIFSFDGLHMNEFGHKTMSEILFSLITGVPHKNIKNQ